MQPHTGFNKTPHRQRPIQCARYALAVTAADDGVRLLLLGEHAGTGIVSVRRAQYWAAGMAAEAVVAAVGAAYRTAAGQAPTTVHTAHTEPGPGSLAPAVIRRAIGPLAELTTHDAPATADGGWPTAVRYALTGLNPDLAKDPKQVTTLAQHATGRTIHT
ncbi:hypothetical protein ACWGJX_45635 [Streptomyces sp. NPDC054775]